MSLTVTVTVTVSRDNSTSHVNSPRVYRLLLASVTLDADRLASSGCAAGTTHAHTFFGSMVFFSVF
jgi:hypothetical protein